ncbi:MAG: phosphate signaling complex protein PhoU [Anaerolineales bacterium]
MLRKTFENEIQQLKDEIIVLGSMVEQSVLESVEALKKRDIESSKKIIELDNAINAKRFALENQVMVLIATQQPMAHDLRLLASILEVISELERMGDYGKGIAVINIRMSDQDLLKPLVDIPRMAQIATSMLHRALTAFVNEDVEAARLIPPEDDQVDDLYNQLYRELMTFVMEDPKNIERANWMLWAGHNLERFADRVTNICERTVFIATGDFKEISSTYVQHSQGK